MRETIKDKTAGCSRRIPGPTPNGGAYAILHYKGKADGSVATPEDAVGIEAVEYDANGEAIFRTYLGKQKRS